MLCVGRAFHEQQGLDDIEMWIGEEAKAEANDGRSSGSAAAVDDGASTSDVSNAAAATATADRMEVVAPLRPKAKEAENAQLGSAGAWDDGSGERDSPRGAPARGRTNSDGNIGEGLQMDVFRVWNDGIDSERRAEGDTGTLSATGGGGRGMRDAHHAWGDFMGTHRDERVMDLVMNHQRTNTTADQGRGGGGNNGRPGGGRAQLRSSLYVCPKCDERLPSLDDLQVLTTRQRTRQHDTHDTQRWASRVSHHQQQLSGACAL
jgi:hypothetical protein